MLARAVAILALLAACLVAAPVAAADDSDEQVVVTGSVVVPRSQTSGTIVIADGPVRIDGTVDGDVVAIHGKVRISGRVDGTVTAISERATLLPGAHVTGDVVYSNDKPRIAQGATVDGDVRDEDWNSGPAFGLLFHLAVWLAVTISAAVLGVLVWWLAPRTMQAASDALRERTGATVACGVGLFVGLPILALLAIATVVGLPFALIVLFALLPLGALGYVTAAWMLGRRLVRGRRNWLMTGLAGFGVLRLLALIPALGFLISLAATVLGLGALAIVVWQRRSTADHPPPAASTPADAAAT